MSLCQALPYCEGAFPTDVLTILRRLHRQRVLVLLSGRNANKPPLGKNEQAGRRLPPPHPANYDWRFANDTRLYLKRRLLQLVGPGASIALLGAPTLFETLQANNHVVLFDPEFYRAFIVRSRELLKTKGWMLLPILPRLTRPSAALDRRRLESFARVAGFTLHKKITRAVAYESPAFELNTLSELGINCKEPWRIADLYIFQKMRDSRHLLNVSRPKRDVRWKSCFVDGLEVKLRERTDAPDVPFRATRIARGGSTLGSVSRRDKRRARIDLWTADNIAFSISRSGPVEMFLKVAQSGRPLREIPELVARRYRLSANEVGDLRDVCRAMSSGPLK